MVVICCQHYQVVIHLLIFDGGGYKHNQWFVCKKAVLPVTREIIYSLYMYYVEQYNLHLSILTLPNMTQFIDVLIGRAQ